MIARQQLILGLTLGAGAGALWGLVFLAPAILPEFGALQLTAGRFVAYGALAAILLLPRWKALTAKLERKHWWQLVWLALLANTLYYALLANAVKLGGMAMASLIVGFVPVAVTIIGSRDHGAVRLKRLMPSLLFSVAGGACIALETLGKSTDGGLQGQIVALLCGIGALVTWTAFAVGNSRVLAGLKTVNSADWSLLIGVVTGIQGLLLVPVALLIEPSGQTAERWMTFAGVCLGLGVFASICGYALWNKMSRILPLTMVGQMVLFETMFALLYAFVWEQRLPSSYECAAMALLLASVMTCIAVHKPARVTAET